MNNSELNKLLKSAKVPEQTTEHWEDFPGQVVRSLRSQLEADTPVAHSQRRPLLAWGLALATCLVIVLVVGHWRGGHTVPVAQSLLQSEKLIREVRALFPNQVRSVVLDDHGLQLVLAEKADLPDAPPIYLNICGPDGCRQIITSSGQQIRLNGEVCDVLADAEGNIILAGKQLIWTSESHTAKAGAYRIEARSLGTFS